MGLGVSVFNAIGAPWRIQTRVRAPHYTKTMMDSARWSRVQKLFGGAVDLRQSEQRSFLENECAGDAALMAEVLAMIEEDARGDSLLDHGVSQVASQFLETSPRFQQAGPYRLVRMIGEGGMGVVYLAERDDLGNVVAIKILRDAWFSPARRERFLTEQNAGPAESSVDCAAVRCQYAAGRDALVCDGVCGRRSAY